MFNLIDISSMAWTVPLLYTFIDNKQLGLQLAEGGAHISYGARCTTAYL
jgi:hypothetical protein